MGNIGAGGQIFKQKTAANLHELRSIVGGANVTVTQNANDLTISASGGGGSEFGYIPLPVRTWIQADSASAFAQPSPDPAQNWNQTNNWNMPYMTFSNGVDSLASNLFFMPSDYDPGTDLTIYMGWWQNVTDANNVDWKIAGYFLADGTNISTLGGIPSSTMGDTSPGPNQFRIRSHTFTPGGTSAADTGMLLQLIRLGASDPHNGDVHFSTATIKYQKA